jgi:hypothetical protein
MGFVGAIEPSRSPVSRPSGRASRRGSLVALAVVGAGLAAVGAGLAAPGVYEGRPGQEATAPARWPAGSTLVRASGRSTLLMLVHSRCPCSRASLEELDRVMARGGDRVCALRRADEGPEAEG